MEIRVYQNNGILIRNKTESTTITCTPQKYYVEQMKPDKKESVFYDSIYIKFKERLICGNKNLKSCCL